MSQSTKRPSLSQASEASEASETSQPILNSTDCESDKNDDEPPPAYTEAVSSQSNEGVTATGLNPVPELPKLLKAGNTLTQHHDPELGDKKDDPPQSQCTEQPASGEESVPEIQIAPSANRATTRSPKRSSFPDASDALPEPKRHEREPPSDELESLRKPHITLPPPGRDILATEELGLLPNLCGGDDEHAPKQTVDSPAGGDSSGAGSHPSLAPELSSAPHLPPLIDKGAAPEEPTSPSYPSLTPTLSSAPHSLPLINEGAAPEEPTSPSHPSLAPELSSEPHMPPLADEGVTPGEPTSSSLPTLAPELSSTPHIQPLIDEGTAPEEPTSLSHPSLALELSSAPHLPPLVDESTASEEPITPSLPVKTHTNDLASEEYQEPQECFKFMPYFTLFNDEKDAIPHYWKSFQGAVQSFARDCLPKKCSWDELSTGDQDQVQEWASNPKEYLNSKFPPDVTNFYAAWLFRLLYHHLFSGKDVDKWNGSVWKGFGALLASGKAHLSEPNGPFAVKYHHWRNLSVQTLADMHHPDKRHVNPIWLREKIKDWMKHLPFVLEKDQSVRQDKWTKLIESAINMDSLIIAARRDIKMRLSDSATGKKYGFPTVKDKMALRKGQIRRAGGDPLVDFVIFPTLLAYGKADTTSIWDEKRPADSVLLPFGDRWDTVSMELRMTVCYH